MRTSIACPKCGDIVCTTHRMQTIGAQLTAHLRNHGLTVYEAKRETFKALREAHETEQKLMAIIFPGKVETAG